MRTMLAIPTGPRLSSLVHSIYVHPPASSVWLFNRQNLPNLKEIVLTGRPVIQHPLTHKAMLLFCSNLNKISVTDVELHQLIRGLSSSPKLTILWCSNLRCHKPTKVYSIPCRLEVISLGVNGYRAFEHFVGMCEEVSLHLNAGQGFLQSTEQHDTGKCMPFLNNLTRLSLRSAKTDEDLDRNLTNKTPSLGREMAGGVWDRLSESNISR